MKKIGLLVVLTLIVNTFFAQKDELDFKGVEVGVPYPVVDADTKYYIDYKDAIIGVKIDGKNITLQTYDTGKLTLDKIKAYEDFPKAFEIEDIMKIEDKIYLFYSSYNRKSTEEQLFYREINTETCSFISEGVKLLSVKGKVTGTYYQKSAYAFGVKDKFALSTSFDENKLLIKYRKHPKSRNDAVNKDVIGLHVYSGALQKRMG